MDKCAAAERAAQQAEKRVRATEEDFEHYRSQQRKTPEAALHQEIARMKGQISDVEARVNAEKDSAISELEENLKVEKEAVKFWKGKFDDGVRDGDDGGFRWERERENLVREVDEVRRESQRQQREREEDMESQRREVTNTFDEVLRVREMESRRREEEVSRVVASVIQP